MGQNISNDSKPIINKSIEQSVISADKKTTITLEAGKHAITMQAGLEYPIMFKEVLAGEYIDSWNIENIIRVLTPLTPTMDKVYVTLKAFFVPHTRVWKEAERALAGKHDIDQKITTLPSVTLNKVVTENFFYRTHLLNYYGVSNKISANTRINILPLRGYRAIQNDYLRNKEYTNKLIEWNETTPVAGEIAAVNYITHTTNTPSTNLNAYYLARARARKSYLNNIKKDIMTNDNDMTDYQAPNGADAQIIYAHLDWQTQYNDLKQRIDNAQKTDAEIIAEMGGAQKVINDRVQLLGMIDYELNYQQITQSAPEIDNSSPLGTTGSFSYTKAQGNIFNHKHFNQHGYIHILANINIDLMVENGIPKEILKSTVDQIYRPGLAEIETQILQSNEIAAGSGSQLAAFQPAWAEYKRLPTIVASEMQTIKLNNSTDNLVSVSNSQWHNVIPFGNGSFVYAEDLTNPAYYSNLVLARNNILTLNFTPLLPAYHNFNIYFENDPAMSMGLHKVKVSLPIKSSALNSIQKAEEK